MPVRRVSFRVPEEIKKAFDDMFAGDDKNAILVCLMEQAIEERRRQRRRAAAIDALLALRDGVRPVSSQETAATRREGRP